MIHQCATCKVITKPEDGVKPIGSFSHGLCSVCAKQMEQELNILEEATVMKKMSSKLSKKIKEIEELGKKCRQVNIRITENLRQRACEKAQLEHRTFSNYITNLMLTDLEGGKK